MFRPTQQQLDGDAPETPFESDIGYGHDESESTEGDSPSLEELGSDEFPSYFIERRGRLYPSNPSPDPLPVDTPEQERHKFLHEVLRHIHGANYTGPVHEALTIDLERQKRVLDVCTGNGLWVLEMATEFPHAYFIGFDHVPIATRYPPQNVRFEVEDVNGPYHWPDASFDLVHARGINLAVRDYRAVLQEIARILRPGGLFISYEWGHFIALHPSSRGNISNHAPATCRFFEAVNEALRFIRDSHSVEVDVASLVAGSDGFANISTNIHYVPIGAWPDSAFIGETNVKAQERYAESVRNLLLDASWDESEVDALLTQYLHELRNVEGLVSVCYSVFAQKV